MLRLLKRSVRPYWAPLIVVIVLQFIQAIANLTLPDLNADIINDGVAKGDTQEILRLGVIMLGVTVVLAITSIVAVWFASKIAMGAGRDLRGRIFRSVESFAQQEVNQFGTASLITRNTNDVQQIQMLLQMLLTMMIGAPMMAIGGVIMAVRQDGPLSLLLLIIIPLLLLVIGLVMRKALPLFRSVQAKLDRINLVMRESLAGVRVIRAFVRRDAEEARFEAANADLTATSLRVNRLFALTIPAIMLIFNLSTVAVIWFGAIRVDSGGMPIGNLIAYLTYLMQILFSTMMAVMMLIMVPRAAASAERINAVVETVPSVRDPETPVTDLPEPRGEIVFEGVDFGYPGAEQPVLKGIDLTIRPGEVTAIVGSTGAGKSTLLNLIPRFYDVTKGRVLVDGVDARQMPRAELWRRIGLVPQKAFLFTGSVAKNLQYGKADATETEMWHALEVAQARDFVATMDGALEAQIGQGGATVSGGQRQRLSIARAIIKRPVIYLFDDSFSALDARTDARLRAALKDETAHATVVIVAQRVGTVMHADRIVVLDEGRVVGVGTHQELLASNETYQEIVASQLTPEEAAA
ncbi:MAG: ABC transporter ATP-binding protein [Chloroflexota bacterium]